MYFLALVPCPIHALRVSDVSDGYEALAEATISNMWELAALVELLERKGLCTKQDLVNLVIEIRKKNPRGLASLKRSSCLLNSVPSIYWNEMSHQREPGKLPRYHTALANYHVHA